MARFFIFLLVFGACGLKGWGLECRRSATGDILTITSMVSEVTPGSVLFLGELHGFQEVARGQLEILEGLRALGHHIDVGFEFFPYPQQEAVDQYVRGVLEEESFLKMIGWGRTMDFAFYRSQALFPRWNQGERTLALNAPRSLTGAIAKGGLEGLSDEQKSFLPPNLELGRPDYFERFRNEMGGHVKDQALRRYFEAQSVWDDTMAWQLARYQGAQTKVVIVGEFHVRYGGGLPHRLSMRAPGAKVVTVGFLNTHDLGVEEIRELLVPHPKWGLREDYVCLFDSGS